MYSQSAIDKEKSVLAERSYAVYLSCREKIEQILNDPTLMTTQREAISLVVKCRAVYACSVRMCGVRYSDMAKAYGVTGNRCRQLATKGGRLYRATLPNFEDRKHHLDLLETKGVVDFDFTSHNKMVEVEKFCLSATTKIKSFGRK